MEGKPETAFGEVFEKTRTVDFSGRMWGAIQAVYDLTGEENPYERVGLNFTSRGIEATFRYLEDGKLYKVTVEPVKTY